MELLRLAKNNCSGLELNQIDAVSRSVLSRLLIGLLMASLLSGCAAMFTPNYDHAELFAPEGTTATDLEWTPLVIHHEFDQQFLVLPRYDTFVTFHLGAASERVQLHRSYNSLTLLDYLNFLGLYIDDALGTWCQYDPIRVSIDSSSGVDTLVHTPVPSFWDSEKRPSFLFGAGFGLILDLTPRGGLAPELGKYQVGIGVRHRFELYYRRSGEGFFGEVDTSFYSLPSVDIQMPVLRYYPFGNYFVEAGPSFIKIGLDSAWWNHAPNYAYGAGSNFIFEHLDGITAGFG